MATSKSLKTAVNKEVKGAQQDAKTGDVATVKETGGAKTTAEKPIGDFREDQARLANTTDLPTNARRSHPPG